MFCGLLIPQRCLQVNFSTFLSLLCQSCVFLVSYLQIKNNIIEGFISLYNILLQFYKIFPALYIYCLLLLSFSFYYFFLLCLYFPVVVGQYDYIQSGRTHALLHVTGPLADYMSSSFFRMMDLTQWVKHIYSSTEVACISVNPLYLRIYQSMSSVLLDDLHIDVYTDVTPRLRVVVEC